MIMNAPELVLHLHVSRPEAQLLRVDIRAENTSSRELYWLNKHWTTSGRGQVAWDPQGPYRHEQGGILRLLYGAAPVPPNMFVNNRYIPHATRIDAGSAADVRAEVIVPVEEFALFEPPSDAAEYGEIEAHFLAVIAHYVVAEDGILINPSFVDPTYFWVRAPNQLVRVAEAVIETDAIPVRRRRDTIARAQLQEEVHREAAREQA